ncbi:MAG: hypothetical protein ACLSDH_02135 [Bacilli bacterium]
MNIPIEHAMSFMQTEIEEFIYQKMQESQVSAGLIEKILESVLCQVRKLKSQDLEKLILELNKEIPTVSEEKVEKHTASIDDFKGAADGNL